MTKIDFPMRQGMEQGGIAELHAALAALELSIERSELEAKSYGPSTADAVRALQANAGLAVTGEVDEATAALVDRRRAERNGSPTAIGSTSPEVERFTLQGMVRDAVGRGLAGRSVTVVALRLRREEELTSGKTSRQGFYRLEYAPPMVAKRPVKRFQIAVRVHDADGKLVFAAAPQVATPRMWLNFMEGGGDFPGESELEGRLEKIAASLHGAALGDLEESDEHADIGFVARGSGLDPEDVAQLAVAHRLERATEVPMAIFYALLRQGLPAGRPESLLAASDRWRRIDGVVGELAAGFYALRGDVLRKVLEDAIARNLIPLRHRLDLDAALARLAALAAQDILDRPYGGTSTTLRLLLDLTNLPHKKYPRFATLVARHGGTVDDGFWAAAAGELSEDEIVDGQRTFELGALVRNHGAMIGGLKARFAQGRFTHARDLARQSPDEWKRIVDEVGAPEDPDLGTTPAQRATAFAAELQARVESAYPTAALAARVERSTARWVAAKPHVRRFFANAADLDLRSVNLDRWLLDHGAAALDGIDADSRPVVVREVKKLQRVLRLAPSAAAATALLAAGHTSAARLYHAGRARAVRELASAGLGRADAERIWETAAHTTALLLARLGELNLELNRPAPAAVHDGTPSGDHAALLARLPSLRALVGPTATARPAATGATAYYADLLRWLRERRAAGGVSAKDVLFRRRPDLGAFALDEAAATAPLSALELTCAVLEAAIAERPYDTLREARYPFDLPFHLPLEEARAGLAALGVPRPRLMAALRGARGRAPSEADAAAESLGLTPLDRKLVITRDVDAQARLWNVGHLDELRGVTRFLEKSGLSRAELEALLASRSVQQGLADTVIDRDDTGAEMLQPLTASRLDRMHRFLRLQRRCGLAIRDLDRLLSSPRIADGALDEDALVAVARARALLARLGLSAEELVAFYADLTPGHYARIFAAGGDAAFAADAVTAEDVITRLDAHVAQLASLLAVSEGEAQALAARTDGLMTLANLSGLWRHARLARALHLSVDELLTALLVVGEEDPFAGPTRTAGFADAVTGLSGGTLAGLDGLLGTRSDGRPDELSEQVARLRDERHRVHAELVRPGEPKLEALAGLLPRLPGMSHDAQRQILDMVAGRVDAQAEPRDARIAEAFAGVADLAEARRRLGPLVGASPEDREIEIARRAEFVLGELSRSRAAARVVGLLATTLALGVPTARVLLERVTLRDDGRTLLAVLLDDDHAAADHPQQRAALQLIAKLAAAVRLLGVSAAELNWLLAHAAEHGGLDLATLPLAATASAPTRASFTAWQALRRLVALERRLGEGFFVLLDAVRDGAGVATILDRLATLTGWKRDDLATLHAAFGLDRDAYATVDAHERLAAAAELMGRVGAPASRLLGWVGPEVGAEQVAEIQLALRGRPVAAEALRVRRRDALVAYLLTRSDAARDRAGLAAHLLVDLDAAPGVLTTRLAAATGAVHLFVGRCLLGLEPDVRVDSDEDDGWAQWREMRDPRQWEADRRLFLRPESGVRGESPARPSPAFVELEERLGSDELSEARAEAALRGYLARLEELARLEVSWRVHDAAHDTLYVIARSSITPPVYYHRRRERGVWTAWERVGVELPAHGLLPVLRHGRLMLFWLVFSEELDAKQDAAPPPAEPRKHWRIRLAWTAQRGGGFDAPQISQRELIHPWPRPQRTYALRACPAGDDLLLDVYVGSSPEFNDRRRFDVASAAPVWLAHSRHDERAAPWHSSQFLWNGEVRAVRVRDLEAGPGRPRALEVLRDDFGSAGRAIVALREAQPRLALPFGARYEHGRLLGVEDGEAAAPLGDPAVAALADAFDRGGVGALYRREARDLDFAFDGPHAQVHWELFFHAPLLIAARFAAAGRFAEAQRWFHAVFDPTTAPGRRAWITPPLALINDDDVRQARLERLLEPIGAPAAALETQVRHWMARPFDAGRLATLRPTALARLVVRRYVENLLSWSERDPASSGHLIELAAQVLGARPTATAASAAAAPSFDELETRFESEGVASLENALPPSSAGGSVHRDAAALPHLDLASFAPPGDEALLVLWDRLDALRAAPAAVEVAAAQLEIPAVKMPAPVDDEPAPLVDDLAAPLPAHRFATALRHARELAAAPLSSSSAAAYELAAGAARRAERAYRFEVGDLDSGFVHRAHFAGRRDGLAAGERLLLELGRMEAAWLDRDGRQLEITRRVSLAQHDPPAFLRLTHTGECRFELRESLFDGDYPGHYWRRIRSLSLTIAAPTNAVNATLALEANSVRVSSVVGPGYARHAAPAHDDRFVDGLAAAQAIVTSTGQDDSGAFDASLRGDRYLPFEGAGAISRWHLVVPRETNDLDPHAIRDVILTLRYTARDGGGGLREAALGSREELVFVRSGARLLELPAKHRGRTAVAAEVWACANGVEPLVIDVAGARTTLAADAGGVQHGSVPLAGSGPWPLAFVGEAPRDVVVALRMGSAVPH